MSFQDDLLRNLRTKDEAETAKQEEMYMRASEQALSIYALIKEALLHNVNEGNFSILTVIEPYPVLYLFQIIYTIT